MLTLQVEKIAKKLSVFTSDDISVILETPEAELQSVLMDLEKQNLLKFDGNSYFYIEPMRPKPVRIKKSKKKIKNRNVYNVSYENYDQDFMQKIIALFCADVEATKAGLFMNISYKRINACSRFRDRGVEVYRGAATYLDNEDEYAAILSHEISHGVDSYDGILRGYFSPLSYGLSPRKFEKKADKRAIDYMVKAGYNPVAFIVMMNKIMPQERYEIFSTHPLTTRRMMYAYEYIYNKYPEYLVNNEYKNNLYYQNFLLTSRANRLKLQNKIESPSTKSKKVQYL